MRRNRRSLCLFGMATLVSILSMGAAVRGQITPKPLPTPTPSLEKQFFKNILRDQKAIWTAPLSLHKADAKWIVPAGIGTMALFTTDRITGDEIAEFDLSKASRILSYPGSIYGVTAAASTFYLIGRKKHDERARETGILIAEGAIDSVIVVRALQVTTQRGRPQTGRERSEFFDGGSSFPSGHSAQAWTMATIVANEYHDNRAVKIAAYGIASAVSVARFTGGKHYISDVVVGSALGYGIGKYVYGTHHRKEGQLDDSASRWPAITPEFNRGARQYGVALTWRF